MLHWSVACNVQDFLRFLVYYNTISYVLVYYRCYLDSIDRQFTKWDLFHHIRLYDCIILIES